MVVFSHGKTSPSKDVWLRWSPSVGWECLFGLEALPWSWEWGVSLAWELHSCQVDFYKQMIFRINSCLPQHPSVTFRPWVWSHLVMAMNWPQRTMRTKRADLTLADRSTLEIRAVQCANGSVFRFLSWQFRQNVPKLVRISSSHLCWNPSLPASGFKGTLVSSPTCWWYVTGFTLCHSILAI